MKILKCKPVHYFTITLALLPILALIRSPIPNIDLGTLLILVGCVFLPQFKLRKRKYFYFLVFIFMSTPIAILFANKYVDLITVFLRYIKFVMLFLFVGVAIDNDYLNSKLFFNTLRKVIIFNFVFITIQWIFYLFGFLLQNPLIQFATYEGYQAIVEYSSILLYRPSGIFFEPSHLAIYGLFCLIYHLFVKENTKMALIVMITIFLTGSGLGIVLNCCILFVFLFLNFKYSMKKVVIQLILLLPTLAILLQTTFISTVISRFLSSNISLGGNAIIARIGLGYSIFYNKSSIEQIFGSGLGNVSPEIYFNGITYIINTIGIIGLVIFFYLMFKGFCQYRVSQKIGTLLFIFLALISQVFTPYMIMFMFGFNKACTLIHSYKEVNK